MSELFEKPHGSVMTKPTRECPNPKCREGRVPELANEDGDVNWVRCSCCHGTGEIEVEDEKEK
jgi:hypothetical protein